MYHLLPPFSPSYTSTPPNSQNLNMQEDCKWLGRRKPKRRLEWKPGEPPAGNWACPLSLWMHLCQHSSSKVPFISTFPSQSCPDCAFLLHCRPYLCKSSRRTLKAPLQQIPTTTRQLLMVPASPMSHSDLLPTVLGKCTPPVSWAAPPLCKEAPSVSRLRQMLTL